MLLGAWTNLMPFAAACNSCILHAHTIFAQFRNESFTAGRPSVCLCVCVCPLCVCLCVRVCPLCVCICVCVCVCFSLPRSLLSCFFVLLHLFEGLDPLCLLWAQRYRVVMGWLGDALLRNELRLATTSVFRPSSTAETPSRGPGKNTRTQDS